MRRKIGYATGVFLLAVQGFGCASGDFSGVGATNQPPKVWVAIGPPEGSVTSYRVEIHWGGWDPDGKVVYYEYAITNNETGVFDPADTTGADKWHRIDQTDTTFTLTADVLADSASLDDLRDHQEFKRGHTFFVRAIDDQGMPSTKPAYRSFTSTTLAPEVFVINPRPIGVNFALMPATITFRWAATDWVTTQSEVLEPDSVRWMLINTAPFGAQWRDAVEYMRTHPDAPEWSSWHYYDAPGDSGKFWINEEPLPFADYVFAVQAKDEAGAVTPVFDTDRNVRRVRVGGLINGPVVTVSYPYMANYTSSTPDAAPAIIHIAAGLPISFNWVADASSYGGNLQGYRYGWDIIDAADPSQWETDLTPFVGSRAQSASRTFYFGTHTFLLEVLDNNHLVTRSTVVVNIVPFTMNRDLLVVDDFTENSGGFLKSGGLLPSDAEHDEFWTDVLSNVAGFSPGADVFHIEGGQDRVPIQILATYKNIIWDARGSYNSTTAAALNDYVKFRVSQTHVEGQKIPVPNYIQMFMGIGGHVLLVGELPMTIAINQNYGSPKYPFVFRYELTGNQSGFYPESDKPYWGVGEDSFAYNDCCLNVIDVSTIRNAAFIRRTPGACNVLGVRSYQQRTEGLRACVPIDETYNFPRLDLRPEVAYPGKWYAPDHLGLNVDIYNPPYFQTLCGPIAELYTLRDCWQPMYALECVDTSSPVYGAPVGFWTSTHAARVAPGSVPARSAVWGFEPALFNPSSVREALGIILFDEWKLDHY